MTETDQQAQGSTAATEGPQEGASQRSGQDGADSASNAGAKDENRVPQHRFDAVNKRMKEAEAKLAKADEEREQQQEEKAKTQGEYQQLADKRQKKIEKLETELKQVKGDWTRERRMNTWSQAAQGVVKPEAIADAFSFLRPEELDGIEEGDVGAFKNLAQNLVDVRGYLAVDGPRGAGSGGSDRPVLQRSTSGAPKTVTGPGGRQVLFKSNRKKPWK